MKWWRQFQEWHQARERRLVAQSIRESVAWFGHDISDMTDEDIEDACRRMATVCGQIGVSAEQLDEAARRLGAILRYDNGAKVQ